MIWVPIGRPSLLGINSIAKLFFNYFVVTKLGLGPLQAKNRRDYEFASNLTEPSLQSPKYFNSLYFVFSS